MHPWAEAILSAHGASPPSGHRTRCSSEGPGYEGVPPGKLELGGNYHSGELLGISSYSGSDIGFGTDRFISFIFTVGTATIIVVVGWRAGSARSSWQLFFGSELFGGYFFLPTNSAGIHFTPYLVLQPGFSGHSATSMFQIP